MIYIEYMYAYVNKTNESQSDYLFMWVKTKWLPCKSK